MGQLISTSILSSKINHCRLKINEQIHFYILYVYMHYVYCIHYIQPLVEYSFTCCIIF